MRTKQLITSAVLLAAVVGGLWCKSGHSADPASGKGAAGGRAAADGKGGPGGPPGGDRPVPVVTTTVEKRDVPIYLEGLGNVIAYNTVTVKTQVDGRLDKVMFKEGQAVHRGDQLAQIDPRPFQVQLHQAEGALARDQAQLKEAQRNLARYQDLAKKKLIAQQQADDQAAAVGQAEGAVRIDEAQVEAARLNLDYARITSPVDGVTGVRLIDAGNLVHASDQTGIVVVTQLDPIAMIFSLPEDVLPEVSKELHDGPLSVEAYSRDGSSKLGSGQLSFVDNQINQTTATLRLKAVFPNPTRSLWPNQFVKARLLLQTRHDAIAVPATVVQRGPKGTFAYVVDTDQTAKLKPVEVEMATGDEVIIASGLSVGDEVVVDGQNSLKPGARVTARPMNTPPGQRGKLTQRESAGQGAGQ